MNGDDKITNLSQLADAALDAHSSWASGEPYLSATTGRAKCDALHGRWRELALRRRAPALELRPTIMGFGPPLSRAAARVALERWRRLRLKGRKPRERMGSVLDSMMKERCLETLKPVLYAPTPTDRLPADEQTLLHALRALAMPESRFRFKAWKTGHGPCIPAVIAPMIAVLLLAPGAVALRGARAPRVRGRRLNSVVDDYRAALAAQLPEARDDGWWDAFAAASERPLRASLRCVDAAPAASFLAGAAARNRTATAVPWAAGRGFFVDGGSPLGRDAAHVAGGFYVMEAASMVAVTLTEAASMTTFTWSGRTLARAANLAASRVLASTP